MNENALKVSYNPFTQSYYYYWKNSLSASWQDLSKNSNIWNLTNQEPVSLHSVADELVKRIIKSFCMHGMKIHLFFDGVDEDWEDLQHAVQRMDKDHLIICEKIEEKLETGQEVLPKIKSIFNSIKTELQSSESSDSAEESDTLRSYIEKFNDTVRTDVAVCVIGTYSSGKSLLINALIGDEILPSDRKPTTSAVFRIESLPDGTLYDTEIQFTYMEQEVILHFNRNGYRIQNVEKLNLEKLKSALDELEIKLKESPIAARIYHTIKRLNSFEDGNPVASIIRIKVPFIRSGFEFEQNKKDINFVFYDTPGSASANHDEHEKALEMSLKEQAHGLVLVVATPNTLDTSDIEELISNTKEWGKSLDMSNALLVVNQTDNEYGAYEDIISEDQEAVMKFPNRGFLVSALIGLGAKKDDMSNCVNPNACGVFQEKKTRFLEDKHRLYHYTTLPETRKKELETIGDAVDPSDERERLAWNSGIRALESELSQFAMRFAAYNKCRQSVSYLSSAISYVTERIENRQNEKTTLLLDLENKLDQEKKELAKRIDREIKKAEEEAFPGFGRLTVEQLRPFMINESANQMKKQLKDEANSSSKQGVMNVVHKILDSKEKKFLGKLQETAISYWRDSSIKCKVACLNAIKSTPDLSDDAKNAAEQYIMELSPLEVKTGTFSFDDNVIKQKRILWFDIEGVWVKWKKAGTQMLEELYKEYELIAQEYARQSQIQYKRWSEELRIGLCDNLGLYNQDVKEQQDLLKQLEKEIDLLESRGSLLKGKKLAIENMICFVKERA